MRTFFLLVATGLWSVFVFFVTLWLTFPSDEFALRVRAEVPARLGRAYSADVTSVGPWWLGVTVHDLRLYHEGPDGTEPRAVLDAFKVSMSPIRSLLRRTPFFAGELAFVDGWLGYQVGTAQTGKKGNWGVSDLVLWSDSVPLGDLLALTGRTPVAITGNVSLDVDVRGGAGGMSESSGHVKVQGSNLTISGIEIPNAGALGFDIPLDGLSIDAVVDKGQLTFNDAVIRGPMFALQIKGTMGLRDPVERSTVDVELVLSDLGEQMKPFEGFLAAAKGTDGAYHFFCRGVVSRMSQSSCSPGKPGATARVGRRAGAADVDEDGDGSEEASARSPRTAEERAARRAERLKRREERGLPVGGRRGGKPATAVPDDGGEDDPLPPEEPVVVPDEPVIEDELPIEEDLPPDDLGEEEPFE